jgi:hypothetical protein
MNFCSHSRHAVILYHTNNYYAQVLYFPKIYNNTLLYDPTVSGTSIDSTSQVCSSSMLVLPTVGNQK